MVRQTGDHRVRARARRLLLSSRSLFRAQFEELEQRVMLDAASNQIPPAVVVGRTLSSYFAGALQNNQETITYTVYNEQADPETGVLLTTTLEPGVTFAIASQQPDRNGQNLAWSLGTIQGYERASVTLTVNLASPMPLRLDSGAHADATLNADPVSNSTPAVTLEPGNVSDPSLLASTPDANTTDPFIQEEAAALSYDPTQIFNFLHTQIGYNSYLGSVRGARGTLWSSAGNALDVASLGVALMRASGIPAQYAQGTLSFSQAQQLILSMFPASDQTVGYIPSGTVTADPADDPQLQSETQNHFWFQFDTGNGMTNADPLMAGATIGQTFTTTPVTFAEVPDAMREKTEVQLQAEIYSQASALFGSSGLSTTTVLDHTFNDVDLVGRPLTIGNIVNTNSIGALVFSSTTNTYSPYIQLGDVAYSSSHDQNIVGDDYQEVLTNFPLGSQILTGLFLNISLSGPQGPTQTYQRALVDRIGYAARQGLAPVNVSVAPGGLPILSDFDVFTLDVLAGLNDPNPVPTFQADVQSDLQIYSNTAFQSLSPTDQAAEAEGMSRVALIEASRDLANTFLSTSDAETAQIAARSLVTAYFDRPRLILVSSRLSPDANDPNGLPLSIDLRRDSMRALAHLGQDANAPLIFNAARGINETVVEGNVLASYLGVQPDSLDTTASVFDAASAQNIGLMLINPDNPTALDALAISAQAKARISTALSLGNSVVVPTQPVSLNGTATIAWYEINPQTGEVVGVTEDGGHQGILSGLTAFQLAVLGIGAGVVVGGEIAIVIDCVFKAAFNKYYPEINSGFSQAQAQSDANAYFVQCVVEENKNIPPFIIAMGKVLLNAIISFGISVIHSSPPPPPPPPPKHQHHAGSAPHRHGSGGMGSGHHSSLIVAIQPSANVQPLDTSPTTLTDPIDYILDALSANVLGLEPTATLLNVPQSTSSVATNQGSAELTVGSAVAAGAVSGSAETSSVSVSGQVAASWASVTTTSFTAQSLSAGTASVTDANGKVVGTGAIALASTAGVAVSVSGSVNYAVSGQASLSFYPPATGNLGVSADWSSFNATLSGTETIQLTTDALTLNGTPLPAGTYTISAPSATIGGSGLGPDANSGGAVSMQLSSSTVTDPSTSRRRAVILNRGKEMEHERRHTYVAAGSP